VSCTKNLSNNYQPSVISTEGALLRRSGEIPALALALAVVVAFALAFLSVIPAGNLLLPLHLLLLLHLHLLLPLL
jgi:hypothetical protein